VTDARTTGALATSHPLVLRAACLCLCRCTLFLSAWPCPVLLSLGDSIQQFLHAAYTNGLKRRHPRRPAHHPLRGCPPAPASSTPSIGIASLNRCSFPIAAATRAGTGLAAPATRHRWPTVAQHTLAVPLSSTFHWARRQGCNQQRHHVRGTVNAR
jgi:hypothetical protein